MELQHTDDRPRSHALMLMAAALFLLLCGFNLYMGRWVYAAFHFMVGLLFFKGKAIDRWPAVALYLLMSVCAAVSVAAFVQLIFDFKAMR